MIVKKNKITKTANRKSYRRFSSTDEAQNDLLHIEDYLLNNWSMEVLMDFNQKYDEAVELICTAPVKFMKYEDTTYHKYLLTKHNSIIYKIEFNRIVIIKIHQNFQDPEENLKNISQL